MASLKTTLLTEKGYEPYDENKKYEAGDYIVIRYSPLSGELYTCFDFAKDGKLQIGIFDASYRILCKKYEDKQEQ